MLSKTKPTLHTPPPTSCSPPQTTNHSPQASTITTYYALRTTHYVLRTNYRVHPVQTSEIPSPLPAHPQATGHELQAIAIVIATPHIPRTTHYVPLPLLTLPPPFDILSLAPGKGYGPLPGAGILKGGVT